MKCHLNFFCYIHVIDINSYKNGRRKRRGGKEEDQYLSTKNKSSLNSNENLLTNTYQKIFIDEFDY